MAIHVFKSMAMGISVNDTTTTTAFKAVWQCTETLPCVMANGGSANTWLFHVKGNKSHEQRDRREGPQREFEDETEEEKESGRWFPLGVIL